METKEIKINIPEGYEIDKENSTFEGIKLKPKKEISNLTYEKICEKLFLGKPTSFIDTRGKCDRFSSLGKYYTDPNNAPSKKQLERLLALNQLINIAYYYNGKHYMRIGHYIGYDKLDDKYFVENCDNDFTQKAEMTALFINAKDAQAVINNPNFRSILDTLCK